MRLFLSSRQGLRPIRKMKLVGGLTFRKLAAFPQAGLTPEQVEEIDAALRAIEE